MLDHKKNGRVPFGNWDPVSFWKRVKLLLGEQGSCGVRDHDSKDQSCDSADQTLLCVR